MKKLLLLFALLPAAFTLQGCDDTATAAGIGFVSGVIVGSGGGYDGGRDCGYYTRCNRYRDYWGRSYRECRRVYTCGGYRRWDVEPVDKAMTAMGVDKAPAVTDRVAALAERYEMSFASAQTLVNAFDQGKKGDFAPFAKLGIGKDEMRSLGQSRMPSDRAVATLAKKLNVSEAHTRAIIDDMNRRVQDARR